MGKKSKSQASVKKSQTQADEQHTTIEQETEFHKVVSAESEDQVMSDNMSDQKEESDNESKTSSQDQQAVMEHLLQNGSRQFIIFSGTGSHKIRK